MHKKWNEEMQHISLSDDKKAKMKAAMHEPITHKKPLAPRLILPAFIALAMLFIIWGPSAPSSLLNASESIVFNDITLRIVIWLTLAQMLLVIGYIFIILCVRNVVRWEHRIIIQRLRALLNTWQGNALGTIVLLLVIASMWIVTLIVPHTLVAEGFFTASFIVCFTSILTYFTRSTKKGTCPHCHARYSYKQLLKISFRTAPTCPVCGEKIAPVTNNLADSASYAWVPVLMLMQHTTLYYWYVVILFIVFGLFIVAYVLPYRTEYKPLQKDDLPPPLW